MRSRLLICLLGLVPLMVTRCADAGPTFILTPAVQSGAVSNEVFFTGSLSNTSMTDNLFLNDIQFCFTGVATNYPTADTNTFFANVPGILLPCETYSDVVFGVIINPATPPGDYFGSVTILGGSNIFAATNLASQPFQLSSPAISISATATDAFRFGGRPGTFVITRTGATNFDLVVNYTIDGTASNGVDYGSIPATITIPASSTSAAISVVPLADTTVVGDETVVITLSNSGAYNLIAPVSATVTIHDTPFNAWRLAEFGTNANNAVVSSDFADPDGDSIVNLLEYALDLDPNAASASGLPVPQIDPACDCLTLTYTKVISAIDLNYTAEAADDPSGPWSSNGVAQEVITNNGVIQIIAASDTCHPIASSGERFMHLKVTRQQ